MKFAMRLSLAACLLIFAVSLAPAAHAASKTFVLLPFTVNAPQSYAYLSKAVPATMQAKLNRPGVLEGRVAQTKAASQAEARKALAAAGADYAVWGSVSVMGNECTIDVNCVDKAGKVWSKSGQGPLSGLTATVQNVSAALGSEVLGVGGARTLGAHVACGRRPARA